MKKYFLLLVLIPFISLGQNEKKIDSVKLIIDASSSDSLKSIEYLQISNYFNHKDSVILYLNKSLKLARTSKQAKYISNSRANISNWKGKYMNSKAACNENLEAIIELEKYNYYSGISNHYARLASRYDFINKDTSKIYLEKALEVSKKVNDDNLFVTLYDVIGTIKYRNSDYDEAFEYFIKAENICSKNKLLRNSIKHAGSLKNIGSILMIRRKTEKAITYFQKAREILILNGNKIRLIELDASLVNAYIEKKKYKSAINLLDENFNSIKDFKIQEGSLSAMYQKKAICLEKLNRKNEAETNFLKALEVSKKSKLNPTTLTNLVFLGDFYFNSNQILKAEETFNEAEKLYHESNDKQAEKLMRIYNGISKIKESQKKYDEALAYSQKETKLKEAQEKKNIVLNIDRLETKYETEKKAQQIALLSSKNKILDLQNKLAAKQTYIFLGILALLLAIAAFLFYAYRNKIKTAQKLNELNELKSRFFANISHEFRTPLTLIKSPVQSLQNEITDANQKNKLDLIDTNSTRMLQLVDQLLELSKIDSGNLQLILKEGNISSFLALIMEPFAFQSKEKGIRFSSNIQKTTENNLFDKDVIEKIVTNLVSNAFKYSPQNEQITFSSSVENSSLKLVVSNTGSDVKKEDLPKLFERFYQKNDTQQGVGIGLALVKELVDLYKGTIYTSVENGELSFVVNLPLAVANENAVVIPSKETTSTIENVGSETELPIVLIVDDNAEIRSLLKDIFKKDYQILEAQDGEEALQLAQKEIPDCIISDVMMPKMDGFEFTKQIKNNELTSFIPVVLLTAKTSDEAHLEGLKSTADAFLTKPFNNEIVKATVQQLISERKKLYDRYSQELVLRPVDIVINSTEEKFIERLQAILDKNLSNSEYTAEDFAAEIGMSRMQLHRKLKSLLGVSATEFLRNERLKVGAELLKKGNGNISEIAYSVGFSDVSYFSKCFKEMYQCTPSEYIEK